MSRLKSSPDRCSIVGFSAKATSRAMVLLGSLAILSSTGFLAGCQDSEPTALSLQWGDVPDRPWPGPHIWANRLQDWEVRGGRLTADSPLPMRTAHILSRRGVPEEGVLQVSMTMGLSEGAGGFLLGAGGPDLGYQKAALIHHSPGPGGGLFIGVDRDGFLMIRDFSGENQVLARSENPLPVTDSLNLEAEVRGVPGAGAEGQAPGKFQIVLTARSLDETGGTISLELAGLGKDQVSGGLALVSHGDGEIGTSTWFSRVDISGDGIQAFPGRRLGPILGTQFTVSRKVLTLTAQLLPISPIVEGPGLPTGDSVLLELRTADGPWTTAATTRVVAPGYTATFRLDEWNGTEPVQYRLTLLTDPAGSPTLPFEGTIRAEPSSVVETGSSPTTSADQLPVPAAPTSEDDFIVAAFTGNHNVASPGVDGGSFDWSQNLWFPHADIVRHVRIQDPDFLFFSGDQVYEGASPTRADFERPYHDYLYKWYLWLWAFRDLTADIPSVALPDDHDVYHGNVWGAGGRPTPPGLAGAAAQDQGGYKLPADWVNMVQRTQASHLPEPWDPDASDYGMEVYFTDIQYGGLSFAVLEDRKFKSPPKLLVPEADVWNGWAQNPAFDAPTSSDTPGASLLGSSQESFLEEWAADWSGGTWMKVVLSQTIFGNVATIPSDAMSGSVIPSLPMPEPGTYVTGDKMAADMDSNGWPPSGRNRALRAMRKGFAVHLAGDQHLASTIQYGLDGFGDGPFALCVPSVANFWPRRWYPPHPGGNRAPDSAPYAGDFLDGFGNPMTVYAVSNPGRYGREPTNLHDRAPGYGIARFNRVTREVSLEAWPRWAEPQSGDLPYPGWPVRFGQEQGYGKEPYGFLPTLLTQGLTNPVVQVVSELGGEVVYTVRISGTRFTPRVFEAGSYSVRVGELENGPVRMLMGLEPAPDSSRSVEVRFGAGED